jgi:hypothetical protein
MTKLLEQAFQAAAMLPPEEQDLLANRLLVELADEQRWDALFAQSQDQLENLAEEALKEHEAGLTETLDPDRL